MIRHTNSLNKIIYDCKGKDAPALHESKSGNGAPLILNTGTGLR